MKKKLFITVALTIYFLIAFSFSVDACHFENLELRADCDGYTIEGLAYVEPGREYLVSYYFLISLDEGGTITIDGEKELETDSTATEDYYISFIINESWEEVPCGDVVVEGAVQLITANCSCPPCVIHDTVNFNTGMLICDCEVGLGCRVTGGGNDTAGINPNGGGDGSVAKGKYRGQKAGQNRYTFGGQAGANTGAQPQPKGEWTHHQQRGPDGSFVFHAGTASAPPGTEIDQIVCSDEGWCNPAREAPSKQIDFAGVGTFKNIKDPSDALMDVVPSETFHWFEVHIEDLGEPGKGKKGDLKPGGPDCPPDGSGTDAFEDIFAVANCGCPDFYRIRIYEGILPEFDPDTGEITNLNMMDVIYEVFGYIDGGNLQIHPPTGFDLK